MPVISTKNEVVTVIALFSSNPENQQEIVDILVNSVETVTKQQPGFISTSIHKSLDGVRVATYAQWRTRADYEAFMNSATGEQLTAKLADFPPPDSHLYEVAVSQSRPGTSVPPKISKGGFLTHFAEFRMKPENQARLVELEKEYIGKAFEAEPGLVSATFHRSLDGIRTINYGQHLSLEAFEEILKAPGFEPGAAAYWVDLAENEFHLYEVVFTQPVD